MKKLLLLLTIFVLFPRPTSAGDSDTILGSVLRGEAPAECQKCRELTACALVRDQERGVNIRSRWYGWRQARQEDIDLIVRARETAMCERYPTCKFVGNGRDLEVWARKGWVSPKVKTIGFCSKHGCTVCVPEVEGKYQEE